MARHAARRHDLPRWGGPGAEAPDRQPLRLEVGSVLPGTLKVYMEGVSRFLRYCGVVRPGQSLVLPREEVDGLMVGFIQHLYDTDGFYSHVRAAGRVGSQVHPSEPQGLPAEK